MTFSPANAKERAEAAVISGDFAAALREGAAAVPALIRALGFKDPHMRGMAAETLGSLRSQDAVQALLNTLKDHNLAVQEAAMQALANIGAPAFEGLEASLGFYDASVARLAAKALGLIGNARSVPALLRMIAENRNVSREYPEMLDAVSAAVDSLAGILGSCSGEIAQQDLERCMELPEGIRLPETQPPRSVDCAPARNRAREELLRRSAKR
jgi:HEAT repeat protein